MNNHGTKGLDAASDIAIPAQGPALLELDVAKYAPHLADFDMTEAQKRELLETLWAILQTFVHLGFDVGKADVCGQLFGISTRPPTAVLTVYNWTFLQHRRQPTKRTAHERSHT